MIRKKEQNLTVPRMLCDKCKLVIPIGAMYAVSDLGRTFCSDCYKEIDSTDYKLIDKLSELDPNIIKRGK